MKQYELKYYYYLIIFFVGEPDFKTYMNVLWNRALKRREDTLVKLLSTKQA